MDIRPGDGYKPDKSIKKMLEGLAYTAGLTILAAVVNHLQGLEELTPKEAIYVGIAISILLAVKNALKHWKDSEE